MAEYSRLRGCSRAAVTLASKRGQIHLVAGKMVDPIDADRTWPRAGGPGSATAAAPRASPLNGNGSDQPPPVRPEDLDYWQERANHERIRARLAELELAQQEGKLLKSEDVERDLFNNYRVVRDALLNVPDRLAAAVAIETNQGACRRLIEAAIRQALTELHAQLRPAD